jgi:murein DD-endopeptidase MepM/ murein hydrolase activator NlpD
MPNFKLTHLPLTGNLVVTSEEGLRIHPTRNYKHTHTGIDLRAIM